MTAVEELRLAPHLLLLLRHASHHIKIVLRLWLEGLGLRLEPATSAPETGLRLLGLHHLMLLHELVHLIHLLLSDILLLLLRLRLASHAKRSEIWLETSSGCLRLHWCLRRWVVQIHDAVHGHRWARLLRWSRLEIIKRISLRLHANQVVHGGCWHWRFRRLNNIADWTLLWYWLTCNLLRLWLFRHLLFLAVLLGSRCTNLFAEPFIELFPFVFKQVKRIMFHFFVDPLLVYVFVSHEPNNLVVRCTWSRLPESTW